MKTLRAAGLAQIERVHVDQLVARGQEVHAKLLAAEVSLQAADPIAAVAEREVHLLALLFDRHVAGSVRRTAGAVLLRGILGSSETEEPNAVNGAGDRKGVR